MIIAQCKVVFKREISIQFDQSNRVIHFALYLINLRDMFQNRSLFGPILILPSTTNNNYANNNLFNILASHKLVNYFLIHSQVQYGMGPLINMQKSVFLPL